MMKLKYKTSKSIKSKINSNKKKIKTKIDRNTKWMIQSIFERVAWIFGLEERKATRKEKSSPEANHISAMNTIPPLRRRWHVASNTITGDKVWSLKDTTHIIQIAHALLLIVTCYAHVNYFFKIICRYVQRFNCPLFK
jgi:hypothetical protein